MKSIWLVAAILAAGMIAALIVLPGWWRSPIQQEVMSAVTPTNATSGSQEGPSKSRLEIPDEDGYRSVEAVNETGRAPAATASDAATAQPLTEEEQQWLKKWGELSVGKLEAARAEFAMELTRLATPAFDEYEMRGDYEVVGVGGSYTARNWDEKPLTAIRMKSQGAQDRSIKKITLRESEYPELYALQRENLWLRKRVKVLREIALR